MTTDYANVLVTLVESKRSEIVDLERLLETKRLVLSEYESDLKKIGISSAKSTSRDTTTTMQINLSRTMPEQICAIFEHNSNTEMGVEEIAGVLIKAGVTSSSSRGVQPMVCATLSRRKDLFEKVRRGIYRRRPASDVLEGIDKH